MTTINCGSLEVTLCFVGPSQNGVGSLETCNCDISGTTGRLEPVQSSICLPGTSPIERWRSSRRTSHDRGDAGAVYVRELDLLNFSAQRCNFSRTTGRLESVQRVDLSACQGHPRSNGVVPRGVLSRRGRRGAVKVGESDLLNFSAQPCDFSRTTGRLKPTIRRLGQARVSVPSEFCLSRGSPSVTADNVAIGSSGNLADGPSRISLSLRDPTAQLPNFHFQRRQWMRLTALAVSDRFTSYPTYIEKRAGQSLARSVHSGKKIVVRGCGTKLCSNNVTTNCSNCN